MQVAERLVLDLVDGDGRVQRSLTFPGGARELMPAEYAYTLPDGHPRRPHVPRPRLGSQPGPGRADGPHRQVTPTVTLYGRPGCHLCDEARETLERVQTRTPFALLEVDITTDDELHMRYLERIPVITLDGEHLFDYEVDEQALERRILYREGR